MGKGKDIIMLSSDSEDINEGPSKGNVPKEDINEGPSKGKLAPLGSSARPRPEVGLELAKFFKYGLPPDLLRWYGYTDVDEYLEDPFFDSPEKETKDKSSIDTFPDERRGKEKVALRDEVSAVWQEGLPPGWELDMISARQKVLPRGWRTINPGVREDEFGRRSTTLWRYVDCTRRLEALGELYHQIPRNLL
ncbi:hypothetical protein Tco_0825530 [Tanacetum coccineum]